MAAAEAFRRWYEYMNERNWSDPAPDVFAPDLRYHVPGLGIERAGSEEIMAVLRAHWENEDVHIEVEDVVESGPFVVAFLTGIQTRDGRRISSSICTVCRMEDGKAAETWTLGGGASVPVDRT